jgi:RimJ/RimL family protein N-acetyltransferase
MHNSDASNIWLSDMPVGEAQPHWTGAPYPPHETLTGRLCRLEPLNVAVHGADLHAAFAQDAAGAMWTYLPSGPFAAQADTLAWLEGCAAKTDPQFYAIVLQTTGRAVGMASFMRIDPANGCIEVGHLAFSPALQRTTEATEAMYLMMRRAFELGYRRYEWKCKALTAPSRRAAVRLGFSFEGLFRQAIVTKGRNRDTAWYSVIDAEWPVRKQEFERWLEPGNFDENGRQITPLSQQTVHVVSEEKP